MIGPSVKADQPDWMNIVPVIEETINKQCRLLIG